MDLRLQAIGLRKVFNRRVIFEGVSFELARQDRLVVTGRNGSGKSTLAKILSNVLSPTSGEVVLRAGNPIPAEHRAEYIGLVSPYLQLYDEFSASENLQIAMRIRGLEPDDAVIRTLLERVSLGARRGDPVRTFSSGMKQRLKYAFALVHSPSILILDEPMANLDTEGIATVRAIMDEHKGILVVATNDLTDIPRYDARVDLNALN